MEAGWHLRLRLTADVAAGDVSRDEDEAAERVRSTVFRPPPEIDPLASLKHLGSVRVE